MGKLLKCAERRDMTVGKAAELKTGITKMEREEGREKKEKKSTERGGKVHTSRLMKTSRNEKVSTSRAQ